MNDQIRAAEAQLTHLQHEVACKAERKEVRSIEAQIELTASVGDVRQIHEQLASKVDRKELRLMEAQLLAPFGEMHGIREDLACKADVEELQQIVRQVLLMQAEVVGTPLTGSRESIQKQQSQVQEEGKRLWEPGAGTDSGKSKLCEKLLNEMWSAKEEGAPVPHHVPSTSDGRRVGR